MSVNNTTHLKVAAPIIADAFVETPLSLTAAAEAANVIAVTMAAYPAAAQYVAEAFDAAMLPALVGAFRIAETGAGSESSSTLKPTLLFKTDANGAAVLSVTDVAGASGLSVFLKVSPAPVQAGTAGNAVGAVIVLTFD